MTATLDEFSPAFSGAFDPPPANQFSAAFSAAFDPPSTSSPTVFTLSGTRLDQVGNVLDNPAPAYLLHVVEPDGSSVAINTIRSVSAGRIECSWAFVRPGTHYFVVVDQLDVEISDRLPVVVTL